MKYSHQHILLILQSFFMVVAFQFCVVVPSNAQGLTNQDLARQYESTGEYDKALVYYEKQYAVDPFGTYEPYLKCLKAVKDFDRAEKLIKKQSKKTPATAKFHVDMGALYELAGEHDKSKKQFDLAIKNLLPDVNDIYQTANAFIQNQKTDYALEAFLKGRTLTRGNPSFGFDVAELFAQKGDAKNMIAEYLELMNENSQFIGNVQAILQNRIAQDTEGKISELLRLELLRKIQREPNQLAYPEFLYWLFLQDKDFESALTQSKSLDKKTGNTGGMVYSLGEICVTNNAWETAEKCFTYITEKGNQHPLYIQARIAAVKALDKKTTTKLYTTEELNTLNKVYQEAINELGKNYITAPLISSYAHLLSFYLNKVDDGVLTLEETIEIPNTTPSFKAECKLDLGDMMILQGNLWDASLIYSQVDKDFKNDAIGREAKFRNARLSYYLGEFDWAAAQLNVLKQATSQLISNDAMNLALLISDNVGDDSITEPLQIYSRSELLAFQNKDNDALKTLDSILILFPERNIADDVWYKQASILLKKKKTDDAIVLLQKIIDKYPDDVLADDALFKMADLYDTVINDKEKAKSSFELFIQKYPGSLFAADARKRFRTLRGDKIN